MKINRIILGSSSKYRRVLFESTGIKFDIARANVNEQDIPANAPDKLASKRAIEKGLAIAKSKENCLVIGADQVLSLDGKAYNKANTKDEARERLLEFAGRTHYLHSAFCIVTSGKLADKPTLIYEKTVDTPMTMRSLTRAEIEHYLDTEEWLGCVGCYQFENRGIHLFEKHSGDSSAIIGLPLIPLLTKLRSLGVNPILNPGGPWEIEV